MNLFLTTSQRKCALYARLRATSSAQVPTQFPRLHSAHKENGFFLYSRCLWSQDILEPKLQLGKKSVQNNNIKIV